MSIKNRTIYANDCLEVLNDRVALPDNSIDLIYLDPPFNSKSNYNLPFKGKYKSDTKPVLAFEDTWNWGDQEANNMYILTSKGGAVDQKLFEIINLSRKVHQEKPNSRLSIGAYLLNMAIRLKPMKRVLKPSGSLYLHCDPKASHYLKMVLDTIFGADNFRNEIVWCYSGGGVPRDDFPRKHDIIFRYSMSETVTFNVERKPYGKHIKSGKRATDLGGTRSVEYNKKGTPINDWWDDINPLINWHKERLGYPTQKPLKLLERILKISSNEGDFVLDPFCGCGTTVNAAESLNRQWIGIDISQFSTGLIRKRLLDNFGELRRQDITRIGVPSTTREAKSLFKTSPFEFEKWVCGAVGAEGMFHDPGTPGPDGGVDGVIPFYFSEPGLENDKVEKTFAIVQVKGGNVSPDNVKALSTTVRETGAKCGVFVCFQDYMNTVNNNKERKQLKDWTGEFPFIQGFSIEQLVKGELPTLPGLSRAL